MNSIQTRQKRRAARGKSPRRSRFRWLLGRVDPVKPFASLVSSDLEMASLDEADQLDAKCEREPIGVALDPGEVSVNQKSISCVINEKIKKIESAAAAPAKRVEQRQETLRPIVSLAFVLPLALIYELGVILLGTDTPRTGIDHWVQQILAMFGAGKLIVLPLVTSAILLAWHHRINDRWQFKISTMGWLLVEAVGLGMIMFFAADATRLIFFGQISETTAGFFDLIRNPRWCSNAITCIGAGLYEELIFRVLIFLPLFTWLARKLNDRTVALVTSMLIVSLLFSLMHYDLLNPAGEPFQSTTFLFRFAGSMILCALFKFRGFAIAVGVHIVFDILMLS